MKAKTNNSFVNFFFKIMSDRKHLQMTVISFKKHSLDFFFHKQMFCSKPIRQITQRCPVLYVI